MMSLLDALVLAAIQGITEWLPVSSSGHLVIAQHFMGIQASVFFDVMLHLGTLIAVFAVFRKKILSLIKAFFKADFKSHDGRTALFIITASVPTAIAGYFFSDFFESLFTDVTAVGIALLITGFWLYCTRFVRPKSGLSCPKSFLIGIAQAVAIVPGISRSGATISTGMIVGVDKSKAAEFSFLLSIPAIIGAAAFKAKDAVISDAAPVAVGVLIAAVVGFIAIKFLLKIINRGKFHYFSYYCWLAGLLVLMLSV